MLFSRAVLLIAFVLSLVACGGGGGGSLSAGPTTTLSGQVLVPNGVVASLDNPDIGDRILNLILPTAMADLTGTAAAPANTTVQLVRLNATGSVASVLGTTTTNGSGAYSFNLASLGVSPDVTLAVQLTGGFLRSIVTGTDIDITTESEVIFQRVVAAVMGGAALTDFTIEEVEALVSGLRRATTADPGNTTGLTIASAIAAVDTVLMGNADLTSFITTASAPGQATQGPGDNNYVPLTQGAIYTYQGSSTISGAYSNTTTISGTQNVDGVSTTRFVSTNLLDLGSDTTFIATNLMGVFDYSVIVEGFGSEPLSTILFPNIANQSTTFPDVVTIGNQTFRFTLETFELELMLTVPAATFTDVLRVRGSLTGINNSDQEIEDQYFAPNIGLIKRVNDSTISGVNEVVTEELMTLPTGL